MDELPTLDCISGAGVTWELPQPASAVSVMDAPSVKLARLEMRMLKLSSRSLGNKRRSNGHAVRVCVRGADDSFFRCARARIGKLARSGGVRWANITVA